MGIRIVAQSVSLWPLLRPRTSKSSHSRSKFLTMAANNITKIKSLKAFPSQTATVEHGQYTITTQQQLNLVPPDDHTHTQIWFQTPVSSHSCPIEMSFNTCSLSELTRSGTSIQYSSTPSLTIKAREERCSTATGPSSSLPFWKVNHPPSPKS